MADVSILDQELPSSENPGLETLDPRFQEIAALVESSDYPKVAEQAEALFNDNVFDIRIIGYYLQAAFLEHGLKSLEAIFSCLKKSLEENWNAIGPVSKKEKHTQRSISWLLTQFNDALLYHREQSDEDWKKWIQEVSSDNIQNMLNNCDLFRQAVLAKFENADSIETLEKIKKWLEDFYVTIAPPAESKEEAPQEEEKSENQEAKEVSQPTTGQNSFPNLSIETAYPLQMLIRKIEAFNVLVEKENFTKAAIIADDINNLISNFDPRIYFPKTFAKYYKNLSHSIGSIAPCWEEKESLPWQMMNQFYTVDLEGFLEEE